MLLDFRKKLDVVGRCQKCGWPIYGLSAVYGKSTPKVMPTCSCKMTERKDIRETMQTK